MVPKSAGFKIVAAADRSRSRQGPAKATGRPRHRSRCAPRRRSRPGQAWEGTVVTYIGPKEYDRLAGLGLEGTINFGGFPVPRKYGGLPMEWLGVPILLLLNWVHSHVGNYGDRDHRPDVVSKVLFYPLTVKSMRSMKAMQTLAPQVNALRSKYKSDPQRLQRETMELYRKHKVNPMGGCLPMVAQIPDLLRAVPGAVRVRRAAERDLCGASAGSSARISGSAISPRRIPRTSCPS